MKFLVILIVILFNSLLYANTLKKVSLQLEWKHQFEFAGFYMAQEKGFYKDIGLDVEFKEFEHGIDISSDVEKGKSTFGINYPTVILDKSKGRDIILLSAILQTSPHVLITLESSNVKSLEDFKNIKVMTEVNAESSAHFISMFQSKNISFNSLRKVPHTFNINDLIERKVDAASIFISNEPFELDKKGIKYKLWDPKDYGFEFYDLILFTSSKLANENPEMVAEFNKASLKGWKYAFDNIEETSEIILNKYNTQNKTKEHLIYEGNILKEMAYHKNISLGNIDKLKIQRIIDVYTILGVMQNQINVDDMIFRNEDILTKEERHHLNKKTNITMCIDPNWMPFEAFDKNGNHTGISSDYIKLFSKKLQTGFKVIKTNSWTQALEFAKQKKCDILPIAMQTPSRKEYMNFTSPYLNVPLIIATKINTSFIDNLSALENKKVAIPKGHAFVEILKKKYPLIDIIEVENINEGLKGVNKNKFFGYIGTLPSVGYLLQNKYNGELKIAGKFEEKWKLGVAVRNDDNILLNIMQKVIKELNPKEQQTILNNWISIKYENGIDYKLISKIILVTVLIILIFIYWNRKLDEAKKQLEEINKKNTQYLDLIDHNILISTSDLNGVITDVSEALCELSGYTKKELIGKNHNIFRHKDMPLSVYKEMWEAISMGKVWQGEVKNLNKDGSFYWSKVLISPRYNELKQINGYCAVRQNITDKKELEKISITDPLTKAFNRLYLDQNYTSEFQRAQRYKKELSIIIIDIDNFKSINDIYGHASGDKVLKDVTNILKKNIRIVDILGRWGGEEFLIICPETNSKNAQILAEHLRNLICSHSFYNMINVTCSFGITMYDVKDKKDDVFIRADKALYKAKNTGKNKVVVF